jgi:aldose 1-epimerase
MDIICEDFGKLQDGRMAHLYTLRNARGAELRASDYGGHVQALLMPDRNGKFIDVALGYDAIGTYEQEDKYIGALIGRCGNRLARGQVTINGKSYQLDCNDGKNHLHGGFAGFNKRLWQAEPCGEGLRLSYVSPAGEGNYPGELRVTVLYSLSDDNAFGIYYEALSDADTICNLTNHTYFNLAGFASGSVLKQCIQIFADEYTETDQESLPDGKILPVAGTPLDLRRPIPIGEHIDDAYEQLRWAGGYDHNWVVRNEPCGFLDGLRKMAYAESDETGITLTAYTTQPGVQFYSGNYLDGRPLGKNGTAFGRRSGFCLEPQYFPNALAHPAFDQPLLKKGNIWKARTLYAFGNKK